VTRLEVEDWFGTPACAASDALLKVLFAAAVEAREDRILAKPLVTLPAGAIGTYGVWRCLECLGVAADALRTEEERSLDAALTSPEAIKALREQYGLDTSEQTRPLT
jgi:hypothetical protein